MTVQVVPLSPEHVRACSGLLWARHERDRAREPALPSLAPAAAGTLVEEALRVNSARGVVALRDGCEAGFMIGAAANPALDSMMGQFMPGRGLSIGYAGHAVETAADARLYRAMYAALSEPFVRAGVLDHVVSVPAADEALRDVWSSLGFGREVVAAVRPLEPLPSGGAAPIEIHRAGPEDIAVVEQLDEALERHHALAPTYLPYRWEARLAFRDYALSMLAEARNGYFVAYRDGKALGMNSLLGRDFLNALLRPDRCVYLYQGIVDEKARGLGVGSGLLAHSLSWAREAGYSWCALHFFSANYVAADFWLGHGFRPLEFRLRRTIDARVNWLEPEPL